MTVRDLSTRVFIILSEREEIKVLHHGMAKQVPSLLRIVFTAGKHTKVTRRRGRMVEQDGSISTLLFLFLLTAVGVSLSFSRWMTVHKIHSLPWYSLQLCFSAMLSANCIGLFMLTCRSRSHGGIPQEHWEWKERAQVLLPLVGLVFFLIGVLILNLLKTGAYVLCLSEYMRYAKEHIVIGISGFLYHILNITFACLITLFIFVYRTSKLRLRNLSSTRCFLTALLAGLMWMHFDQELYFSFFGPINEEYTEFCRENVTYAEKCLCQTTRAFKLSYKAEKYFFPFVIEFILLSAECVIHFLTTMSEKKKRASEVYENAGSTRERSSETGAAEANAGGEGRRRHVADGGVLDKKETMYSETDTDDGSEDDGGVALCSEHRALCKKNYNGVSSPGCHGNRVDGSNSDRSLEIMQTGTELSSDVSMGSNFFTELRPRYFQFDSYVHGITMCGIILSMIFLITTVYAVSISEKAVATNIKMAFFLLKNVYWLSAIAITWAGFRAAAVFRTDHSGYNGFTILLLISTFAIFVSEFFTLVAGIGVLLGSQRESHDNSSLSCGYYLHDGRTQTFMFLEVFLHIIEIFCQSTFIFHVMQLDANAAKCAWPTKYRIYKGVLLYLVQVNLCTWFGTSFILVDHVQDLECVAVMYFTDDMWLFISHCLYPIAIFYRFQSFIVFIMLYFKLK